MEDTLGELPVASLWQLKPVLILVLMEDTLGGIMILTLTMP